MIEDKNATKLDNELSDEELEGVIGGAALAPGPCRPEFVAIPLESPEILPIRLVR